MAHPLISTGMRKLAASRECGGDTRRQAVSGGEHRRVLSISLLKWALKSHTKRPPAGCFVWLNRLNKGGTRSWRPLVGHAAHSPPKHHAVRRGFPRQHYNCKSTTHYQVHFKDTWQTRNSLEIVLPVTSSTKTSLGYNKTGVIKWHGAPGKHTQHGKKLTSPHAVMGVSLSSGLDGHFPLQGDTFSRCSSVETKHVAHKTVHEEVCSDRIMIFGARQRHYVQEKANISAAQISKTWWCR